GRARRGSEGLQKFTTADTRHRAPPWMNIAPTLAPFAAPGAAAWGGPGATDCRSCRLVGPGRCYVVAAALSSTNSSTGRGNRNPRSPSSLLKAKVDRSLIRIG